MKYTIITLLILTIILNSCSDQSTNDYEKPNKPMPDTHIKIISTNPDFVPKLEFQQKAQLHLSHNYKEGTISISHSDSVEFIDQGENFESVSCNLCKQTMETEDWQNFMEDANNNNFTDLNFMTLCCHKKTSLNDLIYLTPAGFAKFVIKIDNPQNEINSDELTKLEYILGTKLKVITANY